ncbi:MAG TPA: gamma-glutamyltransferase [Saprospiraceae bacterium]|nr:gamma-glutamyltransferase [Saprospiraceae bacterium]
MSKRITLVAIFGLALLLKLEAQTTQKPALHAKHWMAITGKPLAATAGASIFQQGGNAIDAACAMIAATSTMWDVLSWGGETQALIYNPHTGKVIGINALGVAPTGATPDFFLNKGMNYPPEYGPLAAVTPGTPGGICTMLAEYGTMSLKQVLAPAMTLASGYPIEKQTADGIERQKKRIKDWKYSKEIFLTHQGEEREAPYPGEIFKQLDLLATLQKMVDAEANALKMGKSRKEAIYVAYDRFYKGDIADEFVRGVKEEGGLITKEDLANWKVYIEEPVSTNYKGIEVYKLTHWVQSPVMLQALNMIEQIDIGCLEYNTAKYLHMLYQVMNMSFADRDFYYGDPYFPPVEPINGLLSKDYAKERVKQINWEKNDTKVAPGDPYPFQGGINPYMDLLKKWGSSVSDAKPMRPSGEFPDSSFYAGTTSVQAADEEGWVVSVTPSGGWIPAVVAGHTGVGLSQRMQSFVLKEEENPFNVVAPGKRPRATLTPTLALKDGKPYLSFAVQGGDSQDQNLLQFFLNVVEFGMNVQEAAEAANINSFQMRGSFGEHETRPGVMLIRDDTPPWTRKKLREMGYRLETDDRTSGPINAIYFDWKNGSMWGGSSNHGEDYGIGW